ncbi:hypothetical protein C4D60_Mb05t03590 [Musa balbisiana]|uniref:Uncharacterized protein n=1 Tax=Musa balbisiana TaxID=52838 RepID=A0A4V4H7W2_MUSBA|nr:hypothetical protein C4D60_Mb05t03590 [Musa balbisiana]
MTRGGWGEGGTCLTRLELEDGVTERTTMHGSGGSYGWPTLGNNHDLATMGVPRNRIVVCYQALGTRYDSEKG